MSKEAETLAAVLRPLLQALGPLIPQVDGSYVARPMQYMYQPFTITNLLNWWQHTPAYSEEPHAVIELIMCSNQPNWDDCHQFTSTLFTSDERW
jgi:hypothetical protein